MAMESAGTKLTREFCKRHADVGNRTLARLLREEYPHEFPTVEAARSRVRIIRGAAGSKKRKEIADKSLIQPLREHCTINIPEGIKQTLDPIKINTPGKYLVLSDIHVPYHCKRSLELAIQKGIDEGCEHVYINGDFYDFYKLSRFDPRPDYRDPDAELDIGKPILEELAKHFKGKKYFKVGNHDARYEAYLAQRAPALCGLAAFRLDKVLELASLGYKYIASKQWAMLGSLAILHGHEFPRGLTDPVNVGRGVYNRLGEGGLVGHWHKTSRHVETSGLKRKMTVAHSTGCLCDCRPEYNPMNRWNNGFATVELTKGGEYSLRNWIIEGDRVYE